MKKTEIKKAVFQLAGEFYGFLCDRYRAVGKKEVGRVLDDCGNALAENQKKTEKPQKKYVTEEPDEMEQFLLGYEEPEYEEVKYNEKGRTGGTFYFKD